MADDSFSGKAAHDLEWAVLLDRIASRCVSDAGAALGRALAPGATPVAAREKAELSRSALGLLEEGSALPAIALPELEDVLERLARGAVATGPELRDVGRLAASARVLRSFLAGHAEAHPALAHALATERTLDALLEEIHGAVDEAGDVMDRASAALARARKKASEARRELLARLSELMNRYGDVLQSRFYTERDGRYVLPIRADAPFRVDGIVLGSSASGSTLYVEPREVTEIGNRRQMADAEVEREVARVLGALSISARGHVDALRSARRAVALADLLAALARFGSDIDATVLSVDDGDVIDLKTMRHPLLGEDENVVANDIRMGRGQGLVISGPNAGGKTVALKCLGLAVWMARAGIPVPADASSRVGWFEPVLTDIGDEQSLARSLSTFSAHAARLARYLEEAGEGALVLLDEVAAGTDPDEGAALAAAVLEKLVTGGAAVAVTTHYERLKQLPARDARFENASVGFDFETMSPTFRLTLGIPGASSALAVAARFGVPGDVVERAEALLPEENLKRDKLLAEIEADRTRAAAELRAAEDHAREQERLREALENELARAREQERARLARESGELTARVREARTELRKATDRLKSGEGDPKELRAIEKAVSAAAREVALGSPLETVLRDTMATDSGVRPVAPGDRVYVPRLRAHAEVLEAPAHGQVKVAAGAMKLTVRLDEVAAPKDGAPRAAKPRKAPRSTLPPARDANPVRTQGNTCDVRGMRVDETKDALEAFVDRLLKEGEPAGFVLHGHGTGALKHAVREHLTAHRFVTRARPADEEDGGDAFTVLWVVE